MQVRGNLRALLGADPLVALVVEAAHEAQPERREDQAEAERDDDEGEHEIAGAAKRAVGLQEEQAGTDDERDAEAALVDGAQALGNRGAQRGALICVERGLLIEGDADRLVCCRHALARRARGFGPCAARRRLAPEHRGTGCGKHERPDDRVAPP